MTNYNIVENLPSYDFADKREWDEQRLRSTAAKLFSFLKINVPAQGVPEDLLLDADQALEHIAFELKMRSGEK